MEGNCGSSCWECGLGAPRSSLPSQIPHLYHNIFIQLSKSAKVRAFTVLQCFSTIFFFFTNQSITFIFYLCSLKLACFKTTCTRVFIDLVGCAVEFWCIKSWAASKHANSVVVRCVFHKAPCSLLNLGGKATKSLLVLNNFYIYGFHHCLCTCGILGYFSRWLW